MKAIHNFGKNCFDCPFVVLYPKDTEKWKQFTTIPLWCPWCIELFCIPKILKNESNSQRIGYIRDLATSCFVSQRYWKMKAIHNITNWVWRRVGVVLYPKDTEKWKQFTTRFRKWTKGKRLFCIPKILKNESNSQPSIRLLIRSLRCFVSQRYWKMKAIHNISSAICFAAFVVLYPKDTEKWKQFTTISCIKWKYQRLFCIPKILKNESNSQHSNRNSERPERCFVSQRYWKMKAIHNGIDGGTTTENVVLYPKDTEKWKQFTTRETNWSNVFLLFCIPKILKNESNSQQRSPTGAMCFCCFVSQRYWKMKAIHNVCNHSPSILIVVLYPKDTEKWKQFTTLFIFTTLFPTLFCIPKILKNESNSQRSLMSSMQSQSCFVSQRYWKMKAIHNHLQTRRFKRIVVLYPKDTEKWKQFTTKNTKHDKVGKLFCIPKILKNESNSQLFHSLATLGLGCFVSQRYWKMKAIHNTNKFIILCHYVVLYPKDTEKWKQFTTGFGGYLGFGLLFCIPKILKNESNSQPCVSSSKIVSSCFVSQRYWKMKAIHNYREHETARTFVVLYPKDTEKWKQFTTYNLARHQ